jgi:heat shock protein HtpX
MSNMFKTAVLLAVLTMMLVLIGGAFGGRQGMLIAFVLALLMNFFSYWFSDKIVLSMYGAQRIDEAQAAHRARGHPDAAGLPHPD